MADTRLKRLADLLVNYSVKVKKGECIFIEGPTYSEPLLMEIFKAVLDAGGHPHMGISMEGQAYAYYSHAQDHHLDYVNDVELKNIGMADAYIALFTSHNSRELSGIDPERMARNSRSSKSLNDLFSKREDEGELRWVGGPFPTQSMAQEASLSMEEYMDFVFASCHLDKDDPVAEWERISAEQQRLCDWLGKREEFRFVGEDTDLSMSCKGRTWVNCDGHINMPDGEVFTGPVEDSVNGKIAFTYPAIYRGNEVLDVKLEFKDGIVTSYSATKGEKFLGTMIGTDEGSNKVGEIAIGTNYGIDRFTKEILFDEKIGGTMHLALGDGIVQSKSVNRSSIHWDMLKGMQDGGRVYADGELFYENGKFLI